MRLRGLEVSGSVPTVPTATYSSPRPSAASAAASSFAWFHAACRKVRRNARSSIG